MKRQRKYNIDNLRKFTKENASYYGARGGYASGKSKLLNKIDLVRYDIGFIYLDLERYKNRVRFYKSDLEYIKELLHDYKIYQNRLNKLVNKYNKKYGDTES